MRLSKVVGIKDTVDDLKEASKHSNKAPVITAGQRSRKSEYDPGEDPEWDDDEDEEDLADYSFEDAHDQMEMYARLRKNQNEKERNEMEDWLMHSHVSNIENYEASEVLKESIDMLKASARKQLDIIKEFGATMRDEIVRVTPDEATKAHLREVQKLIRKKAEKKGKK